jgi:hypothetical protein
MPPNIDNQSVVAALPVPGSVAGDTTDAPAKKKVRTTKKVLCTKKFIQTKYKF